LPIKAESDPAGWRAQDSTKLLGPIVAGDSSRQREQSLSIASGQNQPPPVAVRIASFEFH
jgi:hypothetical protein